MANKIERTGLRYGNLLVLRESGKTIHGSYIWECRCDCGTVKTIDGQCLTSGATISCGCVSKSRLGKLALRHGHSRITSPTKYLRGIWLAMIKRCYGNDKKNNKSYKDRGISVCERWRNGENGIDGFECFILDMGHRPSDGHTIDRRNNNGNYEPDNCRWATILEQNQNKRNVKLTTESVSKLRLDVAEGILKKSEIAKKYGISIDYLYIVSNNKSLWPNAEELP